MPRYDEGGWPAYVPVAERRRKAEREAARLRKQGRPVSPIRIEGRAIAATAWGKAWCGNLESYRDYESRLPRGRTYVRNGSVIDLQVAPGEVKALVSGSSTYRVAVAVAPVPPARWRSICADCAGQVASLVELLQGRLSKGVMERMCRQGTGLFPKPSEIRFSCTCEDHASMCKHVAAVLYGMGARLDEDPALLFRLRAVDAGDLLAGLGSAAPASRPARGRLLEDEDVSALFGLDLAGPEDGDGRDHGSPAPPSRPKRSAGRSRLAPARTPAPEPETVPEAASARAATAGLAAAKPKAARPGPAPTVAKPARSASAGAGPGATPAMPAAPAENVAVQLGKAGGAGRKAAERMVADVVARIGKRLTMGLDVTAASPGGAAARAREGGATRDAAAGSGVQAPRRKQPAAKRAKELRAKEA